MPTTVRYQVRNEFGLGNPELYRAASKDDPEALLEGVAMAGLVGLLKQLGDLAEFASEIFHDLHKELMATATRGHGLMVRVHQMEAEFSAIEKAFLYRSSQPEFGNNMGVSWHTIVQLDHNLITRGGIPRFIVDSYEECRGPPELSTLDKYDVGGAGACLRRYSNPSFFKIALSSSGVEESEFKREKGANRGKKLAPCWGNNGSPEIFSAPLINSKLQPIISDQDAEDLPFVHVKLKSRHLNGSKLTSEIEHLYQVLSHDEKYPSNISNSYSYIRTEPNASSEPVSEVDGTLFDSSAVAGKSLSQTLTVKDATEMEKQRIKVIKLQQALPEDERAEGSISDDLSEGLNISRSGHLEPDQEEWLSDVDWRTEGSSDGYRSGSDNTSSDVARYMDALNTMDSEVETDCESHKISIPGSTNTRCEGPNPNVPNEEPNGDPTSVGWGTLVTGETSINPDSSSRGKRSDARTLNKERITLNVPADSATCLRETCEGNDGLWVYSKVESDSLENSISDEACNAKASRMRSSRSEYIEESFNYSMTDSTSSLMHLCPDGSPESTFRAPKVSHSKSGCTTEKSTFSSQVRNAQLSVGLSDNFSIVVPRFPSQIGLDAPDDDLSPRIQLTRENTNLECLSDEEDPEVSHSVESAKFTKSCFQEKLFPDNMQQAPKVPCPPRDAVQVETVASCEFLMGENVIVGADGDNDGPFSVFSPLTSTSEDSLQQEENPDDLVRGDDDLITETPICLKKTETDEVSAPQMPLSSPIPAESIHLSTFLNSELNIINSADPSDSKFPHDVCHTSSEQCQIDSHPDNIGEEYINSLPSDNGFGSQRSLCCHQEIAGIDTVPSSYLPGDVAEPLKEGQAETIPNLITFERYFSLNTNRNQRNSTDTMENSAYPKCEPDSHNTVNNVSFTEFLKLTQLDIVFNIGEDASGNVLQSEDCFGQKAPLKVSQTEKEGFSMSPNPFEEESEVQAASGSNIKNSSGNEFIKPSALRFGGIHYVERQSNAQNNLLQQTTEEISPLPPLPPLEWTISTPQMEHLTPHLSMEQSASSLNLFIDLPIEDDKPSECLLTAGGRNVQNQNPFVSSVRFEEEMPQERSLSCGGDAVQSVNLLYIPSNIDSEHQPDIFHLEQSYSGGLPREDKSALDNLNSVLDDENPNEKHYTLHRPRDPLIDAVASHDKNTLRKVVEQDQRSTQSKTDEMGSLLEQIRNKSQNLKPTAAAKPNLRGPPTNLKVAAILERANAIRQAFVGSDDDEDEDSWSD